MPRANKEEDLEYLQDTLDNAMGSEVDIPDQVVVLLKRVSTLNTFALAHFMAELIKQAKTTVEQAAENAELYRGRLEGEQHRDGPCVARASHASSTSL